MQDRILRSEVLQMAKVNKKVNKKKKGTERVTSARVVMDAFLRRNATSPDRAIPLSEFKNLPLASGVISYTIANFMNDDVVIKTADDRYYFVQSKWKELEKQVTRGYYMFAALPVIVLVILLSIKHWGAIMSIFGK